MVYYENEVVKAIKKGILPKEVFYLFNNAFIALNTTKDMNLFDIKRLKSTESRNYYRLRKGKYRAIFYTEHNNYFVVLIAKREEVYRLWE